MTKNNNNINEENIDLSKVHQPVRKNIYGKAYLDIMENNVFKISNMAKFVYVYLDARQGKNGFIYEKQENLAKKINISTRSLGDYLKELESIGAIVKIPLFKKQSGFRFLDVIIPKEFNPFTLTFENIENLDEIKEDILKALPYCVIGKPKSKRRSKTVDVVDTVDKSKITNNDEIAIDVENTKVTENKEPKCKIYVWANKSPNCKKLHIPKCKNFVWATFKNGLNSSKPKCKVCGAESEKAFIILNQRKIENKEVSSSPLSHTHLWVSIKENLKSELTEVSYKTWIEQSIKGFAIDGNTITLTAISDFSKGILENRYADLIKSICKTITKQDFNIEFKEK